MGIVFSQAIAAALYYLRPAGLRRAIPQRKEDEDKTNSNNFHCDASAAEIADKSLSPETLLPVVDAESLADLREAVSQTIIKSLGNVDLVKVFLKDPLSNQLVDDQSCVLPSTGFINDVLSQKAKTAVTVNSSHESLRDVLANERSNDNSNSVFLLPIPERGSHLSIGLIVVESKSRTLSNGDSKKMELCVKQVSVTYEVIKSHMTFEAGAAPANRLVSLIQLCSDLNDQDAVSLERKVVRYLQNHTRAGCGFLLLVVPETQELFCQAIGSTALQVEIRFAGPSSAFSRALETKQPMTWEDIPEERRAEVEKVVGSPINNLLCVPVTVADSKELLALACMANKENQEEFNDEDIEIIRQCFKYTATVLTNTLAFQNERKLKNQTQALLQVAKKLFTRLGKFLFNSPDHLPCPNHLCPMSHYPSLSPGNTDSESQSLIGMSETDSSHAQLPSCEEISARESSGFILPILKRLPEPEEQGRLHSDGPVNISMHTNEAAGHKKENVMSRRCTCEFMDVAKRLKFVFDHLRELDSLLKELPFIDLAPAVRSGNFMEKGNSPGCKCEWKENDFNLTDSLESHANEAEGNKGSERSEPLVQTISLHSPEKRNESIALKPSVGTDWCKGIHITNVLDANTRGDRIKKADDHSGCYDCSRHGKVDGIGKGLNEFLADPDDKLLKPANHCDDCQDSDYVTMCSNHEDKGIDTIELLTDDADEDTSHHQNLDIYRETHDTQKEQYLSIDACISEEDTYVFEEGEGQRYDKKDGLEYDDTESQGSSNEHTAKSETTQVRANEDSSDSCGHDEIEKMVSRETSEELTTSYLLTQPNFSPHRITGTIFKDIGENENGSLTLMSDRSQTIQRNSEKFEYLKTPYRTETNYVKDDKNQGSIGELRDDKSSAISEKFEPVEDTSSSSSEEYLIDVKMNGACSEKSLVENIKGIASNEGYLVEHQEHQDSIEKCLLLDNASQKSSEESLLQDNKNQYNSDECLLKEDKNQDHNEKCLLQDKKNQDSSEEYLLQDKKNQDSREECLLQYKRSINSSEECLLQDDMRQDSSEEYLLQDDKSQARSVDCLIYHIKSQESNEECLLQDEKYQASNEECLLQDEKYQASSEEYLLQDEKYQPSSEEYLLQDEKYQPSSEECLLQDEKYQASSEECLLQDEKYQVSSEECLLQDEEYQPSSEECLLQEKFHDCSDNNQEASSKECLLQDDNKQEASSGEDSRDGNSQEDTSEEYLLLDDKKQASSVDSLINPNKSREKSDKNQRPSSEECLLQGDNNQQASSKECLLQGDNSLQASSEECFQDNDNKRQVSSEKCLILEDNQQASNEECLLQDANNQDPSDDECLFQDDNNQLASSEECLLQGNNNQQASSEEYFLQNDNYRHASSKECIRQDDNNQETSIEEYVLLENNNHQANSKECLLQYGDQDAISEECLFQADKIQEDSSEEFQVEKSKTNVEECLHQDYKNQDSSEQYLLMDDKSQESIEESLIQDKKMSQGGNEKCFLNDDKSRKSSGEFSSEGYKGQAKRVDCLAEYKKTQEIGTACCIEDDKTIYNVVEYDIENLLTKCNPSTHAAGDEMNPCTTDDAVDIKSQGNTTEHMVEAEMSKDSPDYSFIEFEKIQSSDGVDHAVQYEITRSNIDGSCAIRHGIIQGNFDGDNSIIGKITLAAVVDDNAVKEITQQKICDDSAIQVEVNEGNMDEDHAIQNETSHGNFDGDMAIQDQVTLDSTIENTADHKMIPDQCSESFAQCNMALDLFESAADFGRLHMVSLEDVEHKTSDGIIQGDNLNTKFDKGIIQGIRATITEKSQDNNTENAFETDLMQSKIDGPSIEQKIHSDLQIMQHEEDDVDINNMDSMNIIDMEEEQRTIDGNYNEYEDMYAHSHSGVDTNYESAENLDNESMGNRHSSKINENTNVINKEADKAATEQSIDDLIHIISQKTYENIDHQCSGKETKSNEQQDISHKNYVKDSNTVIEVVEKCSNTTECMNSVNIIIKSVADVGHINEDMNMIPTTVFETVENFDNTNLNDPTDLIVPVYNNPDINTESVYHLSNTDNHTKSPYINEPVNSSRSIVGLTSIAEILESTGTHNYVDESLNNQDIIDQMDFSQNNHEWNDNVPNSDSEDKSDEEEDNKKDLTEKVKNRDIDNKKKGESNDDKSEDRFDLPQTGQHTASASHTSSFHDVPHSEKVNDDNFDKQDRLQRTSFNVNGTERCTNMQEVENDQLKESVSLKASYNCDEVTMVCQEISESEDNAGSLIHLDGDEHGIKHSDGCNRDVESVETDKHCESSFETNDIIGIGQDSSSLQEVAEFFKGGGITELKESASSFDCVEEFDKNIEKHCNKVENSKTLRKPDEDSFELMEIQKDYYDRAPEEQEYVVNKESKEDVEIHDDSYENSDTDISGHGNSPIPCSLHVHEYLDKHVFANVLEPGVNDFSVKLQSDTSLEESRTNFRINKESERSEETESSNQSVCTSALSVTLYGESDVLSGEDEALDADVSSLDGSEEVPRKKRRHPVKYSLLAINRSWNLPLGLGPLGIKKSYIDNGREEAGGLNKTFDKETPTTSYLSTMRSSVSSVLDSDVTSTSEDQDDKVHEILSDDTRTLSKSDLPPLSQNILWDDTNIKSSTPSREKDKACERDCDQEAEEGKLASVLEPSSKEDSNAETSSAHAEDLQLNKQSLTGHFNNNGKVSVSSEQENTFLVNLYDMDKHVEKVNVGTDHPNASHLNVKSVNAGTPTINVEATANDTCGSVKWVTTRMINETPQVVDQGSEGPDTDITDNSLGQSKDRYFSFMGSNSAGSPSDNCRQRQRLNVDESERYNSFMRPTGQNIQLVTPAGWHWISQSAGHNHEDIQVGQKFSSTGTLNEELSVNSDDDSQQDEEMKDWQRSQSMLSFTDSKNYAQEQSSRLCDSFHTPFSLPSLSGVRRKLQYFESPASSFSTNSTVYFTPMSTNGKGEGFANDGQTASYTNSAPIHEWGQQHDVENVEGHDCLFNESLEGTDIKEDQAFFLNETFSIEDKDSLYRSHVHEKHSREKAIYHSGTSSAASPYLSSSSHSIQLCSIYPEECTHISEDIQQSPSSPPERIDNFSLDHYVSSPSIQEIQNFTSPVLLASKRSVTFREPIVDCQLSLRSIDNEDDDTLLSHGASTAELKPFEEFHAHHLLLSKSPEYEDVINHSEPYVKGECIETCTLTSTEVDSLRQSDFLDEHNDIKLNGIEDSVRRSANKDDFLCYNEETAESSFTFAFDDVNGDSPRNELLSEGLAPIEINYDPFINIGMKRLQHGYFLDKLSVISEESEEIEDLSKESGDIDGELAQGNVSDKIFALKNEGLEAVMQEGKMIEISNEEPENVHVLPKNEIEDFEISSQENDHQICSPEKDNIQVESQEKYFKVGLNQDPVIQMRERLSYKPAICQQDSGDSENGIQEDEDPEAVSKEKEIVFDHYKEKKEDSTGEIQEFAEWLGTHGSHELIRDKHEKENVIRHRTDEFCPCIDEFHLEVSLCIHTECVHTTSDPISSDHDSQNFLKKGKSIKTGTKLHAVNKVEENVSPIRQTQFNVKERKTTDENEGNHFPSHLHKSCLYAGSSQRATAEDDIKSDEVLFVMKCPQKVKTFFSNLPPNENQSPAKSCSGNQIEKDPVAERDLAEGTVSSDSSREETYTSADSFKTGFCDKYYTLSFLDEDDADERDGNQILVERKEQDTKIDHDGRDLLHSKLPLSKVCKGVLSLHGMDLHGTSQPFDKQVERKRDEHAQWHDDENILDTERAFTSVDKVDREKKKLLQDWLLNTVQYKQNDQNFDPRNQDPQREQSFAFTEYKTSTVSQKDSACLFMTQNENPDDFNCPRSNGLETEDIHDNSYNAEQDILNETFIVDYETGNDIVNLSKKPGEKKSNSKHLVMKNATTTASDDDDLDALSEAYGDSMNELETLNEQLITDSSSSKSDSDILNHTSTWIRSLAELKLLQGSCRSLDLFDDPMDKEKRVSYCISKKESGLNDPTREYVCNLHTSGIVNESMGEKPEPCSNNNNNCLIYYDSHLKMHGREQQPEDSIASSYFKFERQRPKASTEGNCYDNTSNKAEDKVSDNNKNLQHIGCSSHDTYKSRLKRTFFNNELGMAINLHCDKSYKAYELYGNADKRLQTKIPPELADEEEVYHIKSIEREDQDATHCISINYSKDTKNPKFQNNQGKQIDEKHEPLTTSHQMLLDERAKSVENPVSYGSGNVAYSRFLDCSPIKILDSSSVWSEGDNPHNQLNDCILTCSSSDESNDDGDDENEEEEDGDLHCRNYMHQNISPLDVEGQRVPVNYPASLNTRSVHCKKRSTNLHPVKPPEVGDLISYHFRQRRHQVLFSDIIGTLPGRITADSFDDLTKLLREIMQEARNLTDAERCSVFLLDKDTDELVAMVFDGITADDKEVQGEIRLPKTQGIAGHVATTGTLLNIHDAYSHPLFYRGIDDSTGFRTRNILCFPIKDEEGVVLGVAQLCNKKTFQYFTTFDEDIASAFAVYCCISISHSLMYKKVIDIQYRNSLANELMMFHMQSLMYKKLQDTQHRHRIANELMLFHIHQQVPTEEVDTMASKHIPPVTVFSPNFDCFEFPPRTIPEGMTVLSCLSMFEDLGFLSRWRIKLDTLVRFLLMVKKGYRNPPYHNWMHAYSVTHFCYLLIKNLHLQNYLEDIELLALFVSCLCHDIDHRGTTNSFQVQSQSVLAALYSSEGSVMERHHLAQSMCILNTEGSNLFEQLSSKEYQTVLDLMKEIILATDLADHLRKFNDQKALAESGKYDRNNPADRNTLIAMIMTSCDLSDQTKNWNQTKLIASLVYQEFFSQGDLEKALGKNPLEMMDRERACIPELQISFLDNIAAPVYRVLVSMFPEASVVVRNVEDNRKHWVHIGELLKLRHGNSTQTMSLDQIISIEDSEVEDTEARNNNNNSESSQQVNGR